MTDHRRGGGEVRRRRVLQQLGVAGFGLAGVGTAAGAQEDREEDDEGEKRGTVRFVESAVTHGVEFPSREVRRHSLVAVNTLPEHVLFEDERVLSYTHLTTRETARLLEESPAGLWHENYHPLPASEVGSVRRDLIGVGTVGSTRVDRGALIAEAYRPPAFNVVPRGEVVGVTVGSEQRVVEPGEVLEQELPAREVAIRLSGPGEGVVEEGEEPTEVGGRDADRDRRGRPGAVERLAVRPTVRVANYGEVTIRAPEGWTPRRPAEPPEEAPRP